jgi:hypothetical protein
MTLLISSTLFNIDLKKVKLSLCLTDYALRHEDVWGSGCIDPRFLDLGTSWRLVVSFTPRPLYPRGKSPRYTLDRRLGGPQSRSGRRGEENLLPRNFLEGRIIRKNVRHYINQHAIACILLTRFCSVLHVYLYTTL